jgi:UDP-glucuronate 4-epimerase
MIRDFTYIDDIVSGVVRVLDTPPSGNADWDALQPDPASSPAPYRLYNIGNQQPVPLMDFVQAIETSLGKKAIIDFQDMQPGDVPATFADVSDLARELQYKPNTSIEYGIQQFIDWYRAYYHA